MRYEAKTVLRERKMSRKEGAEENPVTICTGGNEHNIYYIQSQHTLFTTKQ